MTTTHQHSTTADSDRVSANVAGFGVSYAIACIFNAIVVVLKEAYPAVHDGMAAITGHHWVTHGLLDLIVFIALGYYLSRGEGLHMTGNTLVSWIVGGTVIGGLIIVGYFVL
jgi:hypothetical protein